MFVSGRATLVSVGWTMFYLFVVLKIPILALAWLVWWAVRSEPDVEAAEGSDDGGGPVVTPPRRSGPLPRPPRRGPHDEPAPPSPRRVRAAERTRRRSPQR